MRMQSGGTILAGQDRVFAFDYIRAFCLFLVVVFHVLLGIRDSGIPVSDWAITFNDSMRTVRMPVFFFVSGVLYKMVFESGRSRFWRSLLMGLVVPYIVWSELQGIGKLFLSRSTNNPVEPGDLLQIFWAPIDHFWFIYCLIVLRLLMRLDGGKGFAPPIIFAVSLIYYYAAKLGYVEPGLLMSMSRSGIYFSIGVWFARHFDVGMFRIASAGRYAVLVIAGILAFAVARYLEWQVFNDSLPFVARTLEIVVEPAIGIATMLVIAQRLPAPRGPAGRTAATIAQGSLVIYMLHPMIAAIARTVFIKVGVTAWVPLFVLSMAVALGVPMMIYVVADRLRLLPYFALGPNRGKPRPKADPVEQAPATAG